MKHATRMKKVFSVLLILALLIPLLAASVNAAGEEITITAQPQSQSVELGSTAYFTVAATGKTTLKYQWQVKTSASAAWKNTTISGNRTATLNVPVTDSKNGYQFRCVITDKKEHTVTSEPATLTVTYPLEITAQPQDISAAAGTTAAFTVTATGESLKYQWQRSLAPVSGRIRPSPATRKLP